MKKKMVFLMTFIIMFLIVLAGNNVSAKTKKKTFREKYCKLVKTISSDDLIRMTPEKFSYSFLDLENVALLSGPKYNIKTGNYDDAKFEYVKIVAKETGTLSFSGNGEYIAKAPYGMQNFQFGVYAGDNPDFKDGKIIPDIYVYIAGQFCGHYLSYYNSYPMGEEDRHDKQRFDLISHNFCKDEAYSIDMQKGDIVYIGCSQNSIDLKACFKPGTSSFAQIISGDESIVYNLGNDTDRSAISGGLRLSLDDKATVTLKYQGKTYKDSFVGDYNRTSFYFSTEDKMESGTRYKLEIKLKSGSKYSITRKLVGKYIRRPEGLYEGSYNYKNNIITGGAPENSTIKIQYLGKTYTTKAASYFLGNSNYYEVKLPVKLKANKKLKITIIKGEEERTAIFRI